MKAGFQRDTCTSMCIPALLIIAESHCPSILTSDEWENMCYIHTMGYYLAVKGIEILIQATT